MRLSRQRRRRVIDVADALDEAQQAARLLDPRARTRLTSLEAALAALGYEIGIEVREKRIA